MRGSLAIAVIALLLGTALAGPDQTAALYAPTARQVVVDGATVHAGLDRLLVPAGDNVHLELTATKRVSVAIVTVGIARRDGLPSDEPPRFIGRVTVPLEPGRAMRVPIRLDHGPRPNAFETFVRYAIIVVSPAAADAIERAEHPSGPDPMEFGAFVDRLRGVGDGLPDPSLFGDGKLAVLEAFSHASSPAMSIAAPDRAERDSPFTVAVTITNTTAERAEGVPVTLEFTPISGGYLGMAARDITVTPMFGHSVTLDPGQTQRVAFTVSGLRAGLVGLVAQLRWIGEHPAGVEPLLRGAFDAVEIVPAARDKR